MKKTILTFILLGLNTSVVLASETLDASNAEIEGATLYHNATVVDPATKQLLKDAWLLVDAGKIVKMGQGAGGQSQLPTTKQQLDLKDQFVLPGLIDVHLHLTSGPHRVIEVDGKPALSMEGHEQITRYHAMSTLATGVTTAFSPAGESGANAEYVRQQQAGNWLGPQLTYAGRVFEPMPIIAGSVYPRDEAGWQAEIARQKQNGVSHIKLYTGLNKDEVAMGNRLAKEAGLKTVAHLDNVSWQYAVDQGVDALTHALPTSPELLEGEARSVYEKERKNPLNQRFIYRWFELADYDSEPVQKLIRSMAKQQTRVDLTLVVNELLYFSRELDTLYPQQNMWVFHPQFRSRWRANMAAPSYDWTPAEIATAQQQMPKVQELLKRLYDAGVPLAIGTDSVASGPFYLRELQLSKGAGLDNWQVLQMATINGARHMGLADKGRLAPGFAADFIILTDNPVTDLKAMNTLHTVVQQGKAITVDELKSQLHQLQDVQL